MSARYTTHLLDLLITTVKADSLPLHNLTLKQVTTSLSSDDERPECIEAILRLFSETPHERTTPPVILLNSSLFIQCQKDHKMVRSMYAILSKPSNSNPYICPKMAIISSDSTGRHKPRFKSPFRKFPSSYAYYHSVPSCFRIITYS